MFDALVEHPCRLSNMRGLYSDVIADHVMGFVLSFARNLHLYRDQQRARHWEPIGGEEGRSDFVAGPAFVSEIDRRHLHLSDCTLGVVGVGNIGSEICRRAQSFGMGILGVDPVHREVPDVVPQVWPTDRLPDLLHESDFVVIAAPHTPETYKLFRRDKFELMKKTAYLVNIGRGAIVDLADLIAALESRQIAGAALDVFETEPLPADSPCGRCPTSSSRRTSRPLRRISPNGTRRRFWKTSACSSPAKIRRRSSTNGNGFERGIRGQGQKRQKRGCVTAVPAP